MNYLIGILLSSSLLFACTGNNAKSTDANNADSVKRAEKLHAQYDSANFTQIEWLDSINQQLGKVQEGGVVEVTWRFKNTGEKPLIISNASASCGCTVAEKPEEPIAPGGEGVIKAKFDSQGRPGTQRKEVYVSANTASTNPQLLSFSVEVDKK